jgi:hypothetical protein
MNNIKIIALFCFVLLLVSCSKEGAVTDNQYSPDPAPAIIAGTYYDVVLLPGYPIDNGNGTYTWIWSITNTDPGNQQQLSSWEFSFGNCGATIDDVVGAAVSSDFQKWLLFTPTYQTDPLQNCNTNAVLKFAYGTQSNIPTYYRLIVNKQFPVNPASTLTLNWDTDCVNGYFDGFGCSEDEGEKNCSSEETAWGGDLQFNDGGKGNWAFYIKFNSSLPDGLYAYDLTAGQHYDAGSIIVKKSGNSITVKYSLASDWEMIESHFDIGTSLSDIPYTTNKKGIINPIPGRFDYSNTYNPYADKDEYSWTLQDGYTGYIYIAAHARVIHWYKCP